MRLTRRSVVRTGVLAALSPILDRFGAPFLGASARAQGGSLQWQHGLSLFGELKYPAGFKHFDYVNPSAPKGGNWTIDELNQFINNPRGYVPGTNMTFAGIQRGGERADVIAYLNTLSDNPAPLPKAAEAAGSPKPQ